MFFVNNIKKEKGKSVDRRQSSKEEEEAMYIHLIDEEKEKKQKRCEEGERSEGCCDHPMLVEGRISRKRKREKCGQKQNKSEGKFEYKR